MTNLRNLTLAFTAAITWTTAASASGAPAVVTVPGGMLLIALAAGLSALTTKTEKGKA